MLIYNPPNWLRDKQARALASAQAAGLPRKTDEGWRYTSLQSVAQTDLASFIETKIERSFTREAGLDSPIRADVMALTSEADHVLYFRDGSFLRAASRTSYGDDLYVAPLAKVLMSSGGISEHLKTLLERNPNANLKGLGWLNFARFQEGAFVYLRKKSATPVRVAVVHLYGANRDKTSTVYPRNLYSFGADTKAEILECHIAEEGEFHATAASDFVLENGAQVQVGQVLDTGPRSFLFNETYASLGQNSDLQFCQLTLGGRLVRNESFFALSSPGARARVLGLTVGLGASHTDTSTFIQHVKGQTVSEQLMKAALRDTSRNVFSGRLRIEQDAQKSNARQHCHNLLLSEGAEADARPQLEVQADDVKAAHGATVGQLSAEELFYLQSRGLSAAEAFQLLAQAYQQDVLNRVESPFLRHALEKRSVWAAVESANLAVSSGATS